jgi:heat shock protein HslJ
MSGKNSAFFMPAGGAGRIHRPWQISGTLVRFHPCREEFTVESRGRNRYSFAKEQENGGDMNTNAMRARSRTGLTLRILMVLVVLTGCSKTQQVLVREPAAPTQTLEGRWDLKRFGSVGSQTSIPSEQQVFIDFATDGKISGFAGCNRYFGGWGYLEGSKDTLRVWRTGSTRMACTEPVMTLEYRFLEEITRVSTFAIEGNELRLYYEEGRGVMQFRRYSQP